MKGSGLITHDMDVAMINEDKHAVKLSDGVGTDGIVRQLLSIFTGLSGRLMTGLTVLVLVGISIGMIGFYFLSSVERTLNEITDVTAPAVETAGDMIANIWETNKIAEEIIADEEIADVEELAAEFREKTKRFYILLSELELLVTDETLLESMRQAKKEHQEFLHNTDQMISAHTKELQEEHAAGQLLDEFDQSGAALIEMLDEFANENEREMATAQETAEQMVRSGAASAADLNAIIQNIFKQEFPVVKAALKLQRIVIEMQDTAGEYLAVEDPNKLDQPLSEFNDLAVKAKPLLTILSSLAESAEDKADAAHLSEAFDLWFSTAAQDEQLFDTHRHMLEEEYLADEYVEALEADADLVAASLDRIANATHAISDGADEASAATVGRAQLITSIAVLVLIFTSMLLMFVIQRTAIRPIMHMTRAMQSLASGDLSVDVPAVGKRDEVGAMASAVQVFKDNAIEAKRLRKEQRESEKMMEEEKRTATLKMADDLEASVKGVVMGVADAAREMNDAAQTMSTASTKTSERAVAVASASEEATQTSQTVATAAEELSSSINNINGLVTDTAAVASNGKRQALSTNDAITNLSDRAEKIGNVINLINDIANQTNLLALNATIEAARAGDAGKGFAVVASEVKTLAIQTARATDEIKGQISAMQQVTKSTVVEIEAVSDAMSRINEMTSSVAEAVDQQSLATQEIAHNIQQTANGTQEVSTNIKQVNQEADQSNQAARKVVDVVHSLTAQSQNLNTELDGFLVRLREA